jgi:putative tryptophan/tyrosine transport system substrate-binding protein
MRRRIVSPLVAAALAAVAFGGLPPPLSRSAEPEPRILRVGFVNPYSPSTAPRAFSAFRQRLRELGWVEGQNLVIEWSWADGRYDRLPTLMTEAIARKVDVLVTWGTPAAIAARNTTSTVPIVVAAMGDPIGTGLAATLARPGGNLTGLSMAQADIAGKWLELLQETVPRLSKIAIISNPDSPIINRLQEQLEAAAPARGLKLRLIEVRNPEAFDHAFKQARREAQAVLVLSDPLTFTHRREITAFTARHRLPAIYTVRDFVDEGGLMSYGTDIAVVSRRAADYVDRILKGAKPSDLPIEQPTKFELVVNLKTAQALGLTIPESVLLRADEVIR